MKSFAIVLVGYNRVGGLRRLAESLIKVDFDGRKDIALIFSIDNSGKHDVEDFANSFLWPHGTKEVRTFKERQGLKKHILSCGDYTSKYDIVVVLEDDLLVSDSMYHYAYQAACFYFDVDEVAGISLYNFQTNWLNWSLRFEPQYSRFDTYFLKVAQSWGQVWTQRKWLEFKKWYDKNREFTYTSDIPEVLCNWPETSWLKFHDRYCIETDRYFVYPYVSLSTNFCDAGEHSNQTTTNHQVELMFGKRDYSFSEFSDDAIKYDEYMNRIGLGKYVNIDDQDLKVDFWGTNKIQSQKRYLLTTNTLNYKLLKRYALSLRPIELSVIQNIYGNGIYLYDTATPGSGINKEEDFQRFLYSGRTRESAKVIKFAIKLLWFDLIGRTASKVKKVVRKMIRN